MIKQLDVLNAVMNMLVDALHRPVGLAEIPSESADVPYLIVYPILPDFAGPAYSSPYADGYFPVQVTSVGLRCDQAMWLADRVREAVIEQNAPITVNGAAEMGARTIELGPELVEGDSVDTVVQRFVFRMTPA